MVDIQSVTAEIRRGKKDRKKKKETTGQKYNASDWFKSGNAATGYSV